MTTYFQNGLFNIGEDILRPFPSTRSVMDTLYPDYVRKNTEIVDFYSWDGSFSYTASNSLTLRERDGIPHSPFNGIFHLPSGRFSDIQVNETIYTMIMLYERGKTTCEVVGTTKLVSEPETQVGFHFVLLDDNRYQIKRLGLEGDLKIPCLLTKLMRPVYMDSYGMILDQADRYFIREEVLND